MCCMRWFWTMQIQTMNLSFGNYGTEYKNLPKEFAKRSLSRRKLTSESSSIRRSSSLSKSTGERTVKKLRLSKALTIPDGLTVADACWRMANWRVDAALLTDSSALFMWNHY